MRVDVMGALRSYVTVSGYIKTRCFSPSEKLSRNTEANQNLFMT